MEARYKKVPWNQEDVLDTMGVCYIGVLLHTFTLAGHQGLSVPVGNIFVKSENISIPTSQCSSYFCVPQEKALAFSTF